VSRLDHSCDLDLHGTICFDLQGRSAGCSGLDGDGVGGGRVCGIYDENIPHARLCAHSTCLTAMSHSATDLTVAMLSLPFGGAEWTAQRTIYNTGLY
jgi:hypothetical protein